MSATLTTKNYNLPMYAPTDTWSYQDTPNKGAEIIDGLLKQITDDIESNTSSIAGLVQEDTAIKGSVALLGDRVSDIEAKVPDYDALVNQVTGDEGLATQVATNRQLIDGLDTRTTNLETNVHDLQDDINDLDTRVTANSDAIAALPDIQSILDVIDAIKVDLAAKVFKRISAIGITVFSDALPSLETYWRGVYNNSSVMWCDTFLYTPAATTPQVIFYATIRGNIFALTNDESVRVGCVYVEQASNRWLTYCTAEYDSDSNTTSISCYNSVTTPITLVTTASASVQLQITYGIPQGT